MKDNITVKPDKTRLVNLLDDIATGLICIPEFQRDFVWTERQMRDLFDSILQGYPIGSLLLWKPNEPYKYHTKIGPYEISSQSNERKYVLDGYQRLTTLFAAMTNPKKFNKSEFDPDLKVFSIYYDLKNEEFTHLRNIKASNNFLIPLYKIVDTYEFLDFLNELRDNFVDKSESDLYIDNAKKISKILYDYEIPFIEIKGGDIKSSVEIFSRINSMGTNISEDFMLSALSYNPSNNFLLSNKISDFVSELKVYGFDNISRGTVLNAIASATERPYFDVRFETLSSRNDFQQLTETALAGLKAAIEFLYFNLNIVDSKLLPYPAQLLFLSEYFRLNPNASDAEKQKLKNWFWVTSYSNYFTIYSISQHRTAFNIFKDFAKRQHENGIYKPESTFLFNTIKFPTTISFMSVRAKTLQLFLLNNSNPSFLFEQDYIIEKFIFSKKDRKPGNIILHLSSDASIVVSNGQVDILSFSEEMKQKFFINDDILRLYSLNMYEELIAERTKLIMSAERVFVENLGIKYIL